MPSIQSIIALRFVQGIAVAGVPAVVMTYLAEEIHGRHLPRVMGFYISGTTLGGLLGRLIPGIALDFTSWRYAVLLSAGFAVLMAVITATVIPPQHHFRPKSITWGHELTAIGQHLRNPVLLRLFALPFLLMGTFVSLYNYLGFRLIEDFGLPASLAAMTFLMYLSGTWSSARAGSLVSTWPLAGRGWFLPHRRCRLDTSFHSDAAFHTHWLPRLYCGLLCRTLRSFRVGR